MVNGQWSMPKSPVFCILYSILFVMYYTKFHLKSQEDYLINHKLTMKVFDAIRNTLYERRMIATDAVLSLSKESTEHAEYSR